ncbi:MAG: TolC family protein [Limisphaerales bacterium]
MRARLLAGAVVMIGAIVASAQTNSPSRAPGPADAPAPGPRSMTLQECVDVALRHNLDLQIEHLSNAIAGYELNSAYGPYDPVFSFSATHSFESVPTDTDFKKFRPDFPYELDSDALGPSLSGNLPIGMSYQFSALSTSDFARTDFRGDPSFANSFPGGIRYTSGYPADIGVTFRQHLLKDFWIDKPRETILIRRKDLKISEQALRFEIMKTVLAVELSFYDLQASDELVRVQEKMLELRRQFLAQTQRRVEVGDLPPLDAQQAETEVQNTLTALAAARELFVNRENALKSLFTDNFRQWAEVDLRPAGVLLADKAELNRQKSFQNAVDNRPDLAEARLVVEKRAVSVRFQKNQLFPSLDLVGNLGGVSYTPDLSTSLSDALHFIHPDYYYGAVVSFPLSNVAERNNYRASRAAKQIAELQLKKAEQGILVAVADAVNQVESRYAQVDSTRKARVYAEAALAAEEKKLDNGLTTTFIVLQMQEILTAALTAEAQALVDYNKAIAQLDFAEGGTMEKLRLKLQAK